MVLNYGPNYMQSQQGAPVAAPNPLQLSQPALGGPWASMLSQYGQAAVLGQNPMGMPNLAAPTVPMAAPAISGPGYQGVASSGAAVYAPGAGAPAAPVPASNMINYGDHTGLPSGAGVSIPGVNTPAATPTKTELSVNQNQFELGNNVPTYNMAISGLGTLGNLGLGLASYFQGQEMFNVQKKLAQDNYANALKSYNNSLQDRWMARAAQYGKSEEWAQKQFEEDRLTGKKEKK